MIVDGMVETQIPKPGVVVAPATGLAEEIAAIPARAGEEARPGIKGVLCIDLSRDGIDRKVGRGGGDGLAQQAREIEALAAKCGGLAIKVDREIADLD